MNYIQFMKPGGNFGDKLKTGIKKFLKAAGEASRMAKDARINNPGAAMIRDAYAKGDEELAKLLTDEMQAANLTGIALGSGTAPLITGFTVAPVTTGVTLATGMAGGMAGMYGTDKAINYFSDGKYTGWGDLVNQSTNGVIGENTAGFFHPGTIFGGLATGKIGNKIVGVTNRGKLELLNSALNNNIQATTLQPTVADEAVLRGQLGWAPKQTIPYRHGSLDPELKTFVPKHDRWDVVTHGADPNMYFVTDQSTPVSAANMMDLRPYQYTGNIVAEKPMVQVGDFNIAGKNATRNQLIARARQQGADTYLLQDIVDNKVPHLNIVARFIGPEGEAVHGGALLQTKTTPTKTSLAFFERLPSKISKGERLGIPKGHERTIINNEEEILNNAKSFADKYGYEIPETIDAVKDMYKQHNSWFRTVLVDPLYDNSKYGLAFTDPKLQALPKTESAKILASRGYPAAYRRPGDYEPGIYLDDFVFASPSMATNAGYLGNPGTYTVMLQRPFSFRNPLDWHNVADYRPISKYIYEPLLVGLTLIGNVGPKYELKLATKHLIPVKIAQPTDKGTLLGEYLGNIEYKSGGTIHIKKKNKGKFTDYCNGKVTEECIRKGKNSSNPTTRKRANFAANARKWKHEEGGTINYLNYFNYGK